ncbi:flagellar biosynthesis anti-sigma factor FlgM [Niallia endozanthoxylica]|uniref:Negative regulator of flagellin synthesis n=1 Tax=Niallia endozanthoxylica TaxID=2036016 RepID=A0A5J5HN00_9BACI|nr:flagellar biosynthesis anti-sigma factor FlgM [Niallia endozanthoxylica]KAA9022057.1 flagellar biosynthesis anti-sigma factor FlgM [Niallia endozanthoxylica]
MKINNFRPVNMNPYNKLDKIGKLQAQSVNQKDKIEISKEALEMQITNQYEAERQQRVDELKNKIESGEYKVNPQELAKKMYSYWDDLK